MTVRSVAGVRSRITPRARSFGLTTNESVSRRRELICMFVRPFAIVVQRAESVIANLVRVGPTVNRAFRDQAFLSQRIEIRVKTTVGDLRVVRFLHLRSDGLAGWAIQPRGDDQEISLKTRQLEQLIRHIRKGLTTRGLLLTANSKLRVVSDGISGPDPSGAISEG